MSVMRVSARKQMASAFILRAGLFTDATNTIGSVNQDEVPSKKPVSRRTARQRTKRVSGNDSGALNDEPFAAHNTTGAVPGPRQDVSFAATHPSVETGRPAATKTLSWAYTPSPHPSQTSPPATAAAKTSTTQDAAPPQPTRRAVPTLIIRTLPPAPAKKFHGHFEACSRADMLVQEIRTWEEDAWGIVYGAYDYAATVVGPVPVITLEAAPGFLGGVQILYG
ncbi:hypothetical protein C8R44DRAFT_876708 [Mycena epipterygia]|nr:hypothetical protein C8R44DRAFT_876708 [Mycena epipterygia]